MKNPRLRAGAAEGTLPTDFFQMVPVGCFVLDADGGILAANPAGANLAGLDLDSLIGRDFLTLLAETDRARIGELLAGAVAGQGDRNGVAWLAGDPGGGSLRVRLDAAPARGGGCHIAMTNLGGKLSDQEIIECRSEILRMIARGAPLQEILKTLIALVEEQNPGLIGSVLLMDPDGARLRHGAAPSLPAEFSRAVDGLPIGPSAGSCGTAAFRGEPVFVEDIATDPLWAPFLDQTLVHGLRACWSTPIFGEDGALLGTFAIYYREPALPTDWHRQCIELVTDLAAIAISRERGIKSLAESEIRYRRLVDSGIVGIIIASTDGRISEANDRFLEMVGHTREELESGGVRWDVMTPPEWRRVDERILREIKATGACTPFEKEYFRKDGSRVPILGVVALIEGTEGDCVCILNDLSEQKKSLSAIQRYETIFEKAGWGMVIADPDTHVLNQVNPAFARMHGYERDELIGRPLSDLFSPEDRLQLPALAQKAHSEGRIIYESEHIRKDGSRFPCLTDVTAFKDEEGRVLFRAATFEDISMRKRAEDALRESEANFRLFIRHAPSAIAMFDLGMNYVASSQRWLTDFGLSGEEIEGRCHYDIFPELPERWKEVHRRCLAGATEKSEEDSFVRRDGSTDWIRWEVRPWRKASGKIGGIVIFSEVITQRKLAEDSLRESEARFRSVFEQAAVGVAQIETATGRFIRINQRYCDIVGYSREDLLAMDFQTITHPDDLEADLANMRRLVAGEVREFTMEKRYRRKGGDLVTVRLAVSPMWAPEDEPDFHIAIVEDITARKDAESALLREAQWNDTLLETMVDGFIQADLEGVIQRVNPSYCETVGRSADELVGSNIRDLEAKLNPDEVTRRIAEFQRLGRSRFETRHRHKNGAEIDFHVSLTLVGIGDEARVSAFLRDITQAKKTEQDLREGEERFRLLAQQAPVGIFRTDAEGHCEYVNAFWCQLTGLTAEQARGEGWVEALHPEDRDRVVAAWGATAASKKEFEADYRFRAPDGTIRWVTGRALAQRDEAGVVSGFLGTLTDITERKRAEEKAAESREQLRALLARLQKAREEERIRVSREIHDELGQLLTGLKMDVRWLERKLSVPNLPIELNPLIDRAVAASDLADATIATVQKIAAALRPGALDQLGLAAALTQEARRFQDRSGVECRVIESGKWPRLPSATASELYYICQEALTNVARHAEARTVEIHLFSEGGMAVMEVRDDGKGVSPKARKGPQSLGLLGMKERAVQCGGTIELLGNEPRGTRVMVRVPDEPETQSR